MRCFRGLWLVPFVVLAGAVRAQERPACPLSPSERTIKVRFDPQLETEAVEIYVAPGSSTTIHMPRPIRRKGLTRTGPEGRISVMQTPESPNVLVLLAHGPVGPGEISMAVATVDGRTYPLSVATVPGRMDTRVRVVPWSAEERCAAAGEDAAMEVLLRGKEIAARTYSRPEEMPKFAWLGDSAPPDQVWLEAIFRQANVFYLRIAGEVNGLGAWKVEGATLKGPGGEPVKVTGVQWRRSERGTSTSSRRRFPMERPPGTR